MPDEAISSVEEQCARSAHRSLDRRTVVTLGPLTYVVSCVARMLYDACSDLGGKPRRSTGHEVAKKRK